jgi:glycosyltransferase involved in cell wall biosynthesis
VRSAPDRGARRRVFVNAANVTASGPSVLVADLLPALYAAAPDLEFTTLIPDTPGLTASAGAANARVLTRPRRRGAWNDLTRLMDLHGRLAHLTRASGAEVCLTLGDLGPRRLPCPQVLFLHNTLFVYSPEDLAGHDAWSPAKRRYLMWQFRRSLAGASAIIVQTPVMQARLAARFGALPTRVHVVAQPVPRHVAHGPCGQGRSPLAGCGKPIRLLFLAAYYPHKNHGILPAVVREIRTRGLVDRIHIFLTLGDQAPPALREAVTACADVVTDLGRLSPDSVSAALADASALFLPTLVESYGLVYLEAMACGRPILTSDRDFARWICGDAARYFDPLSARSIVDAMVALPDFAAAVDVSGRAKARLGELPADWHVTGARFADILRSAARDHDGDAGGGRV